MNNHSTRHLFCLIVLAHLIVPFRSFILAVRTLDTHNQGRISASSVLQAVLSQYPDTSESPDSIDDIPVAEFDELPAIPDAAELLENRAVSALRNARQNTASPRASSTNSNPSIFAYVVVV